MGYVTGFGPCCVCTRPFSFNPVRVPSFKGEPICRTCMERVNREKQAQGLPAFKILEDAYEPCSEEELP